MSTAGSADQAPEPQPELDARIKARFPQTQAFPAEGYSPWVVHRQGRYFLELGRKWRPQGESWYVVLQYSYMNEPPSPEQIESAKRIVHKAIDLVKEQARAEVSMLYAHGELWMNAIRWTWAMTDLELAMDLAMTVIRTVLPAVGD